MRKTLYLKFILAYILFAFFGFERQTSRDMYREAVRIADTYAVDLYNSDISLETVQKQMESLSYFMDTEIWIINPSGRMVVNSADAPDPETEIIVEGFDPTVTQKNYYTRGTFFDSFEEEKLSVIAPIINEYKTRGYVIIHKSAAQIDESANSMLNISYLMLIVILFLSLIILIFFTEVVYRPLRKIIAATEQYASGNMHYELPVEGEDEMGYLAASLGYMARTMASFEDDQKKFIANVSHDFRSPLTSIRGFLEAMLDGTIPPEMHEHYLGVVLNETERLTKLTNGLLTLNNLNTRGMILHMTDWNINDVIRNVAASFEQVSDIKDADAVILRHPCLPRRIAPLALVAAQRPFPRDRHVLTFERIHERRIVPALHSLPTREHGGQVVGGVLGEHHFRPLLKVQVAVTLEMNGTCRPTPFRHHYMPAARGVACCHRLAERLGAFRSVRLRAVVRDREARRRIRELAHRERERLLLHDDLPVSAGCHDGILRANRLRR